MSRFEEVINEIDTNNNNIIDMAKTGATMDQITSAAIATQLEIMNRSLAKLVDAITTKLSWDEDTVREYVEEDNEDVDQA